MYHSVELLKISHIVAWHQVCINLRLYEVHQSEVYQFNTVRQTKSTWLCDYDLLVTSVIESVVRCGILFYLYPVSWYLASSGWWLCVPVDHWTPNCCHCGRALSPILGALCNV